MFPPIDTIRHVAVGSTNPVKVAAVRAIVARCAPDAMVADVAVDSGVPDQPWGDAETRRGAEARARAALAATDAELAIGLEGGVVREDDGSVRSCAWAVAVGRDGRTGTGGSLAMPLPPAVVARLEAGDELGPAMDALLGTHGTKHGLGAVGHLTAGLVDRRAAYEVLVAYALVPWLGARFFEGDR